MKRSFADLHLRANIKDQQATGSLIAKAAHLGYSQIAIPLNPKCNPDDINKLKSICKAVGLDFVSRVDVWPRSEAELTHFLRRFRRQFELICVSCDNKEVTRQAAKDRRVDLLNFCSLDYRKRFFDRAEAELACATSVSFEVDVKPLLTFEGPIRVRLMMNLRRELALAREFKVPVVFSSGAGEEHLLRAPMDMASLGYLVGLEEAASLDSVSTNPSAIVCRNREKMGDSFVAPGIRVVRQEASR